MNQNFEEKWEKKVSWIKNFSFDYLLTSEILIKDY